jgi:serine/threonine protein kinase
MIGDAAMDWRSAFMIIRDILKGLDVLHKENLVYSFINLENIEIF